MTRETITRTASGNVCPDTYRQVRYSPSIVEGKADETSDEAAANEASLTALFQHALATPGVDKLKKVLTGSPAVFLSLYTSSDFIVQSAFTETLTIHELEWLLAQGAWFFKDGAWVHAEKKTESKARCARDSGFAFALRAFLNLQNFALLHKKNGGFSIITRMDYYNDPVAVPSTIYWQNGLEIIRALVHNKASFASHEDIDDATNELTKVVLLNCFSAFAPEHRLIQYLILVRNNKLTEILTRISIFGTVWKKRTKDKKPTKSVTIGQLTIRTDTEEFTNPETVTEILDETGQQPDDTFFGESRLLLHDVVTLIKCYLNSPVYLYYKWIYTLIYPCNYNHTALDESEPHDELPRIKDVKFYDILLSLIVNCERDPQLRADKTLLKAVSTEVLGKQYNSLQKKDLPTNMLSELAAPLLLDIFLKMQCPFTECNAWINRTPRTGCERTDGGNGCCPSMLTCDFKLCNLTPSKARKAATVFKYILSRLYQPDVKIEFVGDKKLGRPNTKETEHDLRLANVFFNQHVWEGIQQ